MYINELAILIKARFSKYENVICNDKKELWQLSHSKKKRTCPLKKLTYNEDRKAYRINSQWVTKKRLYQFMIRCDEKLILIEGQETPF
jgi:DNA repair ATPase RecN